MEDAVNLALLLLRVSLGLTIAAHGYNKVAGGISGTASWFESMGMRPGRLNAWMAALTEMGAGLVIAAGLLTAFGSAALIALMVVAGYTSHRSNGFFIFNEGWEYVFILTVAALAVAMIGPGEWSIDHGIDLADKLDGWVGLLLVGGGLVTAAGQVAAFFRPPPAS